MGNFHINLDSKFNDLIIKLKEKEITIEDLIDLKKSVINAYYEDNNEFNDYLRVAFTEIDFKI